MGLKNYYFDTYAFIEIINGNKNYEKYKQVGVITTLYNLIELYYSLLIDFNEETAKHWLNYFKPYITTIKDEDIYKAMQFKKQHKKEKLSYVDCIGYAIANRLNIKFLTGDSKFKNKKSVEWKK
jgi:predicted nucleic acid-binding protein